MDPRRWILRFLLALALLVGAAELVVRSVIRSPSPWHRDAKYGLLRDPGSLVVQSQEGFGRHRVEEHGFLDEPVQPRRPVRALLLGDSFTAGLQVAHRERYSEQVESLLPDVEVLNAGRAGWYPPYYTLLANDIDPAEFDLLIVQIGDGDLLDFDRPDNVAFSRDDQGEWQLGTGEFRTEWGRRRAFINRLCRTFGLVEYLRIRTTILARRERARLTGKFADPTVAQAGAPVEHGAPPDTPDRLDFMHELLAPWHGRILYLYTPSIDGRRPDPQLTWPAHRELMRAFGRRVGAPVVDPSEAMLEQFETTGQPLHGFHNSMMGSGHLNASGHRVVGQALANGIEGMRR